MSTDKAKNLEEISQKFEKVEDALGKPIDKGIFDTVVFLNAFEIPTLQSCEGHLERGIAAPWIDISAEQTEEQKDLWKKYQDLREKMNERAEQGVPLHELRDLIEEANKTEELAKKPILEVFEKVLVLLNEFYESRKVPVIQHLVLVHLGTRGRLESQGSLIQEIQEPVTKKKNFLDYQNEMGEFTAFLKTKYLSI